MDMLDMNMDLDFMDLDEMHQHVEAEVENVFEPEQDEDDVLPENSLFKPDKNIHKEMATHIIWPRFLPQRERHDLEEHETALVALMSDVLDWFFGAGILQNERINKMLKGLHNIKTSPHSAVVSREINRLDRGDIMTMHVKNQNSGFIVYMPDTDTDDENTKSVIVASFPASLDEETIYEHENSDFQVSTVLLFLTNFHVSLRLQENDSTIAGRISSTRIKS